MIVDTAWTQDLFKLDPKAIFDLCFAPADRAVYQHKLSKF